MHHVEILNNYSSLAYLQAQSFHPFGPQFFSLIYTIDIEILGSTTPKTTRLEHPYSLPFTQKRRNILDVFYVGTYVRIDFSLPFNFSSRKCHSYTFQFQQHFRGAILCLETGMEQVLEARRAEGNLAMMCNDSNEGIEFTFLSPVFPIIV